MKCFIKWHGKISTTIALVVMFSLVADSTYLIDQVGVRKDPPKLSFKRALLSTVTVSTDNNATYTYSTEEAECKQVNDLKEQDRCVFAQTVDSCGTDGLINYIEFIYCQVPFKLVPLVMVLLCLWLLYLFIFMGATAQEYFCPSLEIISELLRLNQNVAGVTLLAFGNGAPDIFSAITVIRQPDGRKASLAIGALFGAGMFVTSVVVGAVAMVKPFTLTQRPFLRDILFYLIGVFWTFVILWQNKVTIYSAVGFVVMYVIYVLVVILGRVFFQKWKKWRATKQPGPEVQLLKGSQAPLSNEPNTTPISAVSSVHISVVDTESPKLENYDSAEPIVSAGETSHMAALNRVRMTAPAHGRHEASRLRSGSDVGRPRIESSRPRTRSALQKLGATTLFPAAPADTVLGVLASTVGDSRRHRMRVTIAGALNNGDGGDQPVNLQSYHQLQDMSSYRAPLARINAEESSEMDTESTASIQPSPRSGPHPFIVLLKAFWPFGEDFKDLGIAGKIYEIVKIPAGFLLALTVPVVDREKSNDNWNKWLNVLHCVTAPLFFIVVTKLGFYNIGGVFPLWTLVLILSTILSMFVAYTSKEDKQPVYHGVFAFIGFVVSVIWIYILAGELVSVLQTFGAVFSVSDGILGLTFLAWGNSIGDAVSNVTMARQGFPRMAVGACFGSPLMSILTYG